MQNYLGLDILANWVTMLRVDIEGAIWLCDDTDEAPFYERCKHELSRVVPAMGEALKLLDVVRERGTRGVIATTNKPTDANVEDVFRPSLGDVASLILLSARSQEALQDVVGSDWLRAADRITGSFFKRIASLAYALRIIITDLRLSFALDQFAEFAVDWERLELNWDYIEQLATVPNALFSELKGNMRSADGLRSILTDANGMDVIVILASATSHYAPHGIEAARKISAKDLLAMLRVAYDLAEFEDDDAFWQMRRWERRNNYVLLRRWRILDPLGVLWDQRYWEGDLRRFLKACSPEETLALFKMDLDNFKGVNTKLGHTGGDEAIRIYCEIVQGLMGHSAEVYRRGGDEVIAIAPSCGKPEATILAETLRSNLEIRFRHWASTKDLQAAPTASIGVLVTDGSYQCADVIRILDEAQQRAKDLGKNRVELTELFAASTQHHA